MVKRIEINGKTFRIQELTITDEPVWAKNTGRAADGSMVGDIICWKAKLEVKFPPMSDEEASSLGTAVHKAFFNVKFHHPRTNTDVTKVMYAGTPTYPIYNYHDSLKRLRYVGVTLDFIEK